MGGRNEDDSPSLSQVSRGNSGATHQVQEDSWASESEGKWGELGRKTHAEAFLPFLNCYSTESWRNQFFIESGSPFYYHRFSQTQWQPVIGFFNRTKLMLKEKNVLFEASRLYQFCWFSVIHILHQALHGWDSWGILDQTWGCREKGESVQDSLLPLPFFTSHQGLKVVSLTERSKKKQPWESSLICNPTSTASSERGQQGSDLGWHIKKTGDTPG